MSYLDGVFPQVCNLIDFRRTAGRSEKAVSAIELDGSLLSLGGS